MSIYYQVRVSGFDVTRFTGFRMTSIFGDVFVGVPDMGICAGLVCAGRENIWEIHLSSVAGTGYLRGTRLCGSGISHFSREHWIIPNPAHDRGKNPEEYLVKNENERSTRFVTYDSSTPLYYRSLSIRDANMRWNAMLKTCR